MASITIKGVPDQLPARLRKRAAMEGRSMNKEIIRLPDPSLSAQRTYPAEQRRTLAVTQTEAWSRPGGRWISDVPVEDEVDGLHSARSGGRGIEL